MERNMYHCFSRILPKSSKMYLFWGDIYTNIYIYIYVYTYIYIYMYIYTCTYGLISNFFYPDSDEKRFHCVFAGLRLIRSIAPTNLKYEKKNM